MSTSSHLCRGGCSYTLCSYVIPPPFSYTPHGSMLSIRAIDLVCYFSKARRRMVVAALGFAQQHNVGLSEICVFLLVTISVLMSACIWLGLNHIERACSASLYVHVDFSLHSTPFLAMHFKILPLFPFLFSVCALFSGAAIEPGLPDSAHFTTQMQGHDLSYRACAPQSS